MAYERHDQAKWRWRLRRAGERAADRLVESPPQNVEAMLEVVAQELTNALVEDAVERALRQPEFMDLLAKKGRKR